MVGQELATELADAGARTDHRLRDHLAELRTATVVNGTTAVT
jgi:hypothetical protein